MTNHTRHSLGLGFRVHVPLTVNSPEGPQVATGAPKYSGWHPVEHCSPGTRPTQLAGQGREPLTVGIVLALQTAGDTGDARYSKARQEVRGGRRSAHKQTADSCMQVWQGRVHACAPQVSTDCAAAAAGRARAAKQC